MKEEPPAMLDPRYITGKQGFITEDTKRWRGKIENTCEFKVEFESPVFTCDITKKECSYYYCPFLKMLKLINPRHWSNND